MPPVTKKPAKAASSTLVYPNVGTEFAVGDVAITAERAKSLLGWEEEPEQGKGEPFAEDYLLQDQHDRKIRCLNNVENRPFYWDTANGWLQEILNRRWAGPNGTGGTINGEPIILGQRGQIWDGQHTLVAIVWAQQLLDIDRQGEGHWKANWPDGVIRVDKLIVSGIDEAAVNTMNTCRPRTVSDVLYRSKFLAPYTRSSERKEIARMTDAAIRFLWERTGQDHDRWTNVRTHSEALDMLQRHPTILRSVHEIYHENSGNEIAKNSVPQGIAAGIHYLMCVSDSDPDIYYDPESPRAEKQLSFGTYEIEGTAPDGATVAKEFSRMDYARNFWVALVSPSPEFAPVRTAIKALADPETMAPGPRNWRIAILAKAWALWVERHDPADSTKMVEITEDELALQFTENETTGTVKLAEIATFGGIDRGSQWRPEQEEAEANLTPDEIEAEKAKIRAAARVGGALVKEGTDNALSSALKADLEKLEKRSPGTLKLFRTKDGYVAYEQSAHDLALALRGKAKKNAHGLTSFVINETQYEHSKKSLQVIHRLAIVEPDGDEYRITDVPSENNPSGKPTTAAPKPKKLPVGKKPALRGGV